MEIILKEDIDKLGHRGDVVKVADGYGRNYLLPQNLGMEATAANEFERKVGENDHIFGSVTSSDVAHALAAKGFTIDRRKISLSEPLKQLGEFEVPVKLHREVTARVKVIVKSDGSEPEPAKVEEEEVRGTYAGEFDRD